MIVYIPLCTACGEPSDELTVSSNGIEQWCPDCLDSGEVNR